MLLENYRIKKTNGNYYTQRKTLLGWIYFNDNSNFLGVPEHILVVLNSVLLFFNFIFMFTFIILSGSIYNFSILINIFSLINFYFFYKSKLFFRCYGSEELSRELIKKRIKYKTSKKEKSKDQIIEMNIGIERKRKLKKINKYK